MLQTSILSADELKMIFFPKPVFHPAFWVRKPPLFACIDNWFCNGDVSDGDYCYVSIMIYMFLKADTVRKMEQVRSCGVMCS